jgi:hypothetical protein
MISSLGVYWVENRVPCQLATRSRSVSQSGMGQDHLTPGLTATFSRRDHIQELLEADEDLLDLLGRSEVRHGVGE